MSKLKLDLDVDLVQATVKSQVEPAIQEVLAKHDIKKMIVKALEAPVASDDHYYFGLSVFGRDKKPEPLIDSMVKEAVSSAAKEYVAKAMRENKEMVEEAFKKMMQNSSSKLAKSFAKAISDGIDGKDWGFKLDVNVSHTVPEQERDYD